MQKLDLLAVGDIVIDAFIKLQDAKVHCNINNRDCELCVRFGDKIPYESVTIVPAVGNSPNAAVAGARLGLNTALVTNIGDDKHGQDCLEALGKNKVTTEFITKEKGKATNYHYVLWYEVDRTILVKHTEFEYKFPALPQVSWLYLSSLASNSLPYHLEIAQFLKERPETKLAFQPGTFQLKLGTEKLRDLYTRTEIFFSNLEEAQLVSNEKTAEVLILANKIHALGPKIVCISDGPKGAYLFLENELWHIPMYPDSAPPLDRTGAGDAFSATFTAALALNLSPLEALTWGPINSMAVVQKIGAQEGLLRKEEIQTYLKNAPADYKPRKIN